MYQRSVRGDRSTLGWKVTLFASHGRLKAERNRNLARIEQRIEDLCPRIDQQPIVQESCLIPDRQTLGDA